MKTIQETREHNAKLSAEFKALFETQYKGIKEVYINDDACLNVVVSGRGAKKVIEAIEIDLLRIGLKNAFVMQPGIYNKNYHLAVKTKQ